MEEIPKQETSEKLQLSEQLRKALQAGNDKEALQIAGALKKLLEEQVAVGQDIEQTQAPSGESIEESQAGVPQGARDAIGTLHSYMRPDAPDAPDAPSDSGNTQAETLPEESPESVDSPETMSAEEIAQEIYNLTGTEISIFGTSRGLEAPLTLVIGANGLDDAIRLQHKGSDTAQFERGRGSNPQTGFHLYKMGPGNNRRKVAEIVRKSQDAVNRAGFKGIRIIFPQEDGGLADKAADDESVYQAAIERIWQELGDRLPENKRKFFVPRPK